MGDVASLIARVHALVELEETRSKALFHNEVSQNRRKTTHDVNCVITKFKQGDLILKQDNWLMKQKR